MRLMRNLFLKVDWIKASLLKSLSFVKGIAGVPYDILSLPVDAYGIAAVYMQAGDKLDINRN